MIETQISEMGTTIVLTRDPVDESAAATTAELLAAIDDLARGWLVPLGVGLRVACCDPERGWVASMDVEPAQPHWFLRVAELSHDVDIRAPLAEPSEHVEPQLDHATIARWASEAAAQPCAPGHVPTLIEVEWVAVRARLPTDEPIVVMDGRFELPAQLESHDGVRWALGPSHAKTPAPAWLRGKGEHGAATIVLAVRWYLWIDHPALVDAAIARVLARPGWLRER